MIQAIIVTRCNTEVYICVPQMAQTNCYLCHDSLLFSV